MGSEGLVASGSWLFESWTGLSTGKKNLDSVPDSKSQLPSILAHTRSVLKPKFSSRLNNAGWLDSRCWRHLLDSVELEASA